MKKEKEVNALKTNPSLRGLRFIGLLLTAISSVLILTFLINEYETRLELPLVMIQYSEFVNQVIQSMDFLNQTAVYMTFLLIGIALIGWSISKTTFWSLLITLSWLAATDATVLLERNALVPISHVTSPFIDQLDPILKQVVAWMTSLTEWLVPLTALFAAFVLWRGLKHTKSKYIASYFIRYFALILSISIFIDFLRESFYETFVTLNVLSMVDTIQLYSYVISYSLLFIGSVIGLTGLFRK